VRLNDRNIRPNNRSESRHFGAVSDNILIADKTKRSPGYPDERL